MFSIGKKSQRRLKGSIFYVVIFAIHKNLCGVEKIEWNYSKWSYTYLLLWVWCWFTRTLWYPIWF